MRPLKTLLASGVIALAGVGAVLVAPATVAVAVTEVEQIIESCGSQAVCQYDGATISNASDLANALPPGVQVVVIPQPDQAESLPSSVLASGLLSATEADTVIVIEDRASDRFAVASNQDATAITEALYSQGQADGGVAVAGIAQTLVPPDDGESGAGVDGMGLGGVLVAAALAVAVVGGALGLFFTRRASKARKAMTSSRELERELAEALKGEDGQFVRQAILRLDERAATLPHIGPRIAGLSGHVAELFVRVRRRGSDQQIRLLQAQYKDTLSKLLGALDDDYYGDIHANPHFWSNPEARLEEVGRAVESVDRQAVENIRQVNESRDLDFQVALDSLIKTVNEAKLSDVYRDREK